MFRAQCLFCFEKAYGALGKDQAVAFTVSGLSVEFLFAFPKLFAVLFNYRPFLSNTLRYRSC